MEEFDANGNVLSIEEKPDKPNSGYAVVGLYFYPNSVVPITKSIQPSELGELKVNSLNQEYLENRKVKLELIGRGCA